MIKLKYSFKILWKRTATVLKLCASTQEQLAKQGWCHKICRSDFYSPAYSVIFWITRTCRRSDYAYACYKSGLGRKELGEKIITAMELRI